MDSGRNVEQGKSTTGEREAWLKRYAAVRAHTEALAAPLSAEDRKSTRLNSSH